MTGTTVRRSAIALVAGAGLACLAPSAAVAELKPHAVVYRAAFKGVGAGDLILTLRQQDDGRWLYETRARPSMLARMVVNAASRERSWFELTEHGVRPLRYLLDDGSTDDGRDMRLDYDWPRLRVTGFARGAPVDLALEPGAHDAMSIRAAVMVDLAAGRQPAEYRMIDRDEIKTYVYRHEGTARLATPLGQLETVVYSSDRKGASGGRSWKYWYAPSLNYLPVRIEQRERGETRLVLALRSVEWL